MIRKLLVAVDGSKHSVKAILVASDMCGVYGATMTLVNVRTRDLSSEAEYFARHGDLVTDELDLSKVAEKVGRKIIDDAIRSSGIEVTAKSRVLFGDVADAIVRFAKKEQVDAIVMGNHGLSDLKGVFLGSVSYKVNSLSHCTCINVKSD